MKNTISPNILSYLSSTSTSSWNLNSENMQRPEELNVDEIIEKKFYSSRTFAEEIESIVKNSNDMKYVDAIVYFCEKNSLDLESIPKLISKPLKERLKAEATELNLLKKTSHAKLPI